MQTRSFCYVDDLIKAFLLFMETPDNITGPINIGNPVEFTMLELAKLIIEMTASKSRIVYKPIPIDDPRQRKPDISKALDTLGWEPQIQLKEGLTKTIDYFKKSLQ